LRWFLIFNPVKHWINRLKDCIVTPSCALCDSLPQTKYDICHDCLSLLLKNTDYCPQCGSALTQNEDRCEQCLINPPVYQRTVAPFVYHGAIAYLIKKLKFNNQYQNAKLLGQLFTAELSAEKNSLPECIIPVPLHKNRYQQRGFNQSLEIARTVSKNLDIPLALTHCIRHRDTPHQVGLSADERFENIKQAFSLVKPLAYQHIAVFDDVMTTGSTVAEIAELLKTAGAETVEVWVCARAY
jgi:ComF family protein